MWLATSLLVLRILHTVHISLSDIETAVLIKLQSIGNIPFSNHCSKVTATWVKWNIKGKHHEHHSTCTPPHAPLEHCI